MQSVQKDASDSTLKLPIYIKSSIVVPLVRATRIKCKGYPSVMMLTLRSVMKCPIDNNKLIIIIYGNPVAVLVHTIISLQKS